MNKAFESIKQGLIEAIEFSEGKRPDAMVHKSTTPDVKAIHRRPGERQTERE